MAVYLAGYLEAQRPERRAEIATTQEVCESDPSAIMDGVLRLRTTPKEEPPASQFLDALAKLEQIANPTRKARRVR